jgi:hypothetical protein
VCVRGCAAGVEEGPSYYGSAHTRRWEGGQASTGLHRVHRVTRGRECTWLRRPPGEEDCRACTRPCHVQEVKRVWASAKTAPPCRM